MLTRDLIEIPSHFCVHSADSVVLYRSALVTLYYTKAARLSLVRRGRFPHTYLLVGSYATATIKNLELFSIVVNPHVNCYLFSRGHVNALHAMSHVQVLNPSPIRAIPNPPTNPAS